MPSVSEIVAVTLAAHVQHVFGVMGNGNAYLLDALQRRTSAAYWPVRHEAGAVVAADAHFRASGRIAAATTTYGAGFTNSLTALAEAVQARIPLVLVVGDEPTSGPRAWDVDQIALASAVGARTYTVGRSDAAATTVIALEHALAYQLPTVLAIPYDVARVDGGAVPARTALQRASRLSLGDPFARATLDRAVQELDGAARPFLLAGRGAWLAGAGPALGRLADACGAVTGSTALARGLFPRVEFDVGVVGGWGADGAMAAVREADAVVVFGAALNQFTTAFGELFAPGTSVTQVDVAPSATYALVGRFIRGDAAVVADALATGLASQAAASSGWRDSIDRAALLHREPGDALSADGRLDPRSAAMRIGELLPPDRVVVSDGGHFIGWANMYWPVASPDRMIMVGTAYQAIGLGFPSVAGAATARPDATVVLTTGVGGGLMALSDLESAVRVAGGRGVAVVWNDGQYGAETNVYGELGLARELMLIPEVDFAAIARAVGAEAVSVRTLADLDRLREWTATPAADRRFLLLDLHVSPAVVAPYQREILRHQR